MSGTQKAWRWRQFDKLARNRAAAVLVCGVVAMLVGAIFTAVRLPVPKVHDEFSYLLAADTFSSGRLTNPTHPMWEHFESFHTIQQPSYNSKYQPGQGLILAFGTLLGGHPIVGAWFASALAAAAVCWMLQGWVPGRWALIGGLLVALHGMIQVRWSLSFWGGSLPMAGGALMFGALPRIRQQPKFSTSLLMASGAILLASTRPFEGFLVGICVATTLVLWMFSHERPAWTTVFSSVALPSVMVLATGIAGLGYYNWQVSGDPLQLPYQVHEAEYGYSPLFLWKTPQQEPVYRHEVMRDFQTGWAIEDYEKQQTLAGWMFAKTEGFKGLMWFFLGGALWIPLLMMLRPLLARQQLRFVWVTLALFLAAEMTVPWMYPHYFAPAAPLLFLLVVQGLRYLSTMPRLGYAWMRLAVPAVVCVQCAALPILFAKYVAWQPDGWEWNRAQVVKKLENLPGKHLVLVEYGPEHIGHAEWVYNRANIDDAKVVWARPMGPAKNTELLDYFHDRNVWQIDADAEQPKLCSFVKTPLRMTASFD